MRTTRHLKNIFFILICSGLFSTLPQIFSLPLGIQEARADTVTYYFNAYDAADPGNWDSDEANVVDGSTSNSGADNDDNNYIDLTANESTGTDLGTITAVEVRGYFKNNYNANPVRTVCPEFIPYFSGTDAGDVHTPGTGNYDASAGYPQWGSYYDITTDTNAPGTWTWSEVQNLDMRLQLNRPGGRLDVYRVEIRVTYTSSSPLTLADHAECQEPDRLDGDVSQTGVEMFAFQLSNSTGSTQTQNGFEFQLSAVNGMLQADFDNFYIYVDADGSGDIEGGETTKVCSSEATAAVSGATGTLAFSSCGYDITDGTTVKMVLTGDLDNLAPGDSFTIDLGTADLTPAGDGSDATTTAHVTDGATGYQFRKRITIDKNELDSNCSANLTDFPLLVILTGNDFSEVAAGSGTGYDVIFKDADGNQLDYEIEEYDETTDNRLTAWVRVPTIYYDRHTVIWMYYGNPSVTAATENPAGVWDSNFVGVWHLEEDVTDEQTSGTHDDSTGVNDGSQNNNGPVAGRIAGGQEFDGTGDYVVITDVNDDVNAAKGTISVWIKMDPMTGTGYITSVIAVRVNLYKIA